jgi:uncharacterized protein YcbK (DUF882 family)
MGKQKKSLTDLMSKFLIDEVNEEKVVETNFEENHSKINNEEEDAAPPSIEPQEETKPNAEKKSTKHLATKNEINHAFDRTKKKYSVQNLSALSELINNEDSNAKGRIIELNKEAISNIKFIQTVLGIKTSIPNLINTILKYETDDLIKELKGTEEYKVWKEKY